MGALGILLATITGSLIPTTDNTYDVGSSVARWKDLYLSGTGTSELAFVVTATNTAALSIQDGNGTPTLAVDTSNRRVGIGISNPSKTLQVHEITSATPAIKLTNASTGTTANDGVELISSPGSGGSYLYNRENGFLQFGTNNADRMRITNTGEVGILTTTPQSELDVRDLSATPTTNVFQVANKNDSTRYFTVSSSSVNITQDPVTATSPTGLKFTGGAHTLLTASTEAIDVDYNLARTVQFSAGTISTQRAFVIRAPTYSFDSPSTITLAETLVISGAPIAGTNATITTPYALRIESGNVLISGFLFSSGFFAGSYGFSSTQGLYFTSASRWNVVTGTLASGGAYPMRLRSGDGLTAFGGLITLEADGAPNISVSATATTIGHYSAGYSTGIGTLTPSASLTVAGNGASPTSNIFEVQNRTNAEGSYSSRYFTVSSTATIQSVDLISTATDDIGWTVQSAANQACNTTCTNACVVGFDATAGIVACTDAAADQCLCAGAS